MRSRLHMRPVKGAHYLLVLGLLIGTLSGCMPIVRGAVSPKPTPARTPAPRPSAATESRAVSQAEPHSVPFMTEVYTSALGQRMTYYLHVPQPYSTQRSYPLVLLLHGGGEVARASNTPAQNASVLLSQQYVSIWASATVQNRWPSFIVVPQLVAPSRWVNIPADTGSYELATNPTEALLLALDIVTSLQQEYATINARRIYLTGLSMGGYGAWEAAERWPYRFAAVAPLAGAGDPALAGNLVNLPVWAFQGSDDVVVPISGSRDMIRAIQAAGGHPRYTEYPGTGHDIWVRVYSNPTFLAWLFAQERPPATVS
ncbi:MAG TPA: alpha/beta hydrolase-fold protein [Ktedonobacterales bacterium]|nr:alpha/beta hydrolase-fold protein [Ktedonobacterales bacterium]